MERQTDSYGLDPPTATGSIGPNNINAFGLLGWRKASTGPTA
jgi:hypothetical protein